jgi:arylsulfatase A-like enzyme
MATDRRRPNILLVMADQLAVSALPFHGNPVVQAPHLARLAAGGVVFDNAYCNFPICAPSRFSMLSGRLPHAIGAYDNASEFPAATPTLAHYLRHAGYRTILCGKMHFIGSRPAAWLRGTADDRHLPRRLQLDTRLAQGPGLPAHRRQHAPGAGSRPLRAQHADRLRRRGGVPRHAEALRPGAHRRRPAVLPDGVVHASAPALRGAAAPLGPVPRRGHRPAARATHPLRRAR